MDLKNTLRKEIIKRAIFSKVKDGREVNDNEEKYFLFDIPGFSSKLKDYKDEYSPATDALCFDREYYHILQDIKKRKEIKSVTDIGCAFAFQSEHFISNGYRYVGIDVCSPMGDSEEEILLRKALRENNNDSKEIYVRFIKERKEKGHPLYRNIPFFNEEHPLCKFYIGHFPEDLTDEMIQDCFISNMSVGYENPKYINLDEIPKGYARFNCGYYHGDGKIESILDEIFPHKEVIYKCYFSDLVFYSR